MSAGFIVGGKATCPVDGLSIRTFAEDAVHRFPSKGKRARAVELVISAMHTIESYSIVCGASAKGKAT